MTWLALRISFMFSFAGQRIYDFTSLADQDVEFDGWV